MKKNYRRVSAGLRIDDPASNFNSTANSHCDGKALRHLCPWSSDRFVSSSCIGRCGRTRDWWPKELRSR
jgi:hypothetical protein